MKPLVQIGLLVLFCGVWCNVITAAETDNAASTYAEALIAGYFMEHRPKNPLEVALPKTNSSKTAIMQLYPNPASQSQVTVRFPMGAGDRIRVYDMYGKLHKNIGIDGTSTQAVITNLPTGVYLLHLTRKGKPLDSQKLIIAQ